MNWVLITIGLIFLVCFIVGIYRGAVRIAVSLVTTLLTLVIVVFATPYVSKLISELTPMDEMIEEKVSAAMVNAAQAKLVDAIGESGISENDVKDILDAAGISEEKLNEYGVSAEDIAEGKISSEQLSSLGISDELLKKAGGEDGEETNIPRELQQKAIKEADLPDVFKSMLETNNNDVIYEELGVKTFSEYVGSFLAKLIVNIVAFLCTFLIVTIILRAIVFALDIVTGLPGLGIINHLAGGAVGIAVALIIVWVLFIFVTLLYTTAVGKDIYATIQAEPILKLLYECNPVMKLAAKI
ncbi:MAG: CvpA family protein [Lachnospiraceae bacterium]